MRSETQKKDESIDHPTKHFCAFESEVIVSTFVLLQVERKGSTHCRKMWNFLTKLAIDSIIRNYNSK